MNILACFSLSLFFAVIPIGICVVHYRYPQWFYARKIVFWLIGTAFFSWGYVNAVIWIPYTLNQYQIKGPEAAFALFFGWLYLWLSAIPVLLVYIILLLLRYQAGKTSRGNR